MPSSQHSAASAYQDIGRQTGVPDADAHGLILLLYDGALEALARARRHMEQGDIRLKCETLTKAINIITDGLKASLDVEAGGAIGRNLSDLYDYMTNRLVLANLENRPEILLEVIELLRQLRDAWSQIGKGRLNTPTNARTGSAQVSARNSPKVSPATAVKHPKEDEAQSNADRVARYYGVK